MRDKRIDQLTAVTPVGSDLTEIWDISNPGTKKITLDQLAALLAPAGALATLYYPSGVGATVNIPALVGKTIKLLLRGGIGAGEVIILGVPDSTQVLFNSATGDLTAGNPWIGELLTIQYS